MISTRGTNSVGGVATAANRKAMPRATVVPAIPLPYLRQQQQSAHRSNATKNGHAISQEQAVVSAKVDDKVTPAPLVDTLATDLTTMSIEPKVSGTLASSVGTPAADPGKETNGVTSSLARPDNKQLGSGGFNGNDSASNISRPDEQLSASGTSPASLNNGYRPPSLPPHAVNMAPFDPSTTHGHLPGPPFGHQHHAHHAHPSNGSIIFGAPHDSNNTSPTPHSGAFVPPPGLVSPPGFHRGGAEGWAGPGHPFAPVPGPSFHPMPAAFDPISPQSFHGSQSSGYGDEGTFVAKPVHNGTVGHRDTPGSSGHMVLPSPRGAHPGYISHPVQEALSSHLRGFYRARNYADFADCRVVFEFSNDRFRGKMAVQDTSSIHVDGHRVILSQSRLLGRVLRGHPTEAGNPPVYRVVLDDSHIYPESVDRAIAMLYGFDAPMPVDELLIARRAGQPSDVVLEKAFSHVSTGYQLGIPLLAEAGVQLALDCLDEIGVAKVLQFGLSGASGLCPVGHRAPATTRFKYEGYAERLVMAALYRIIYMLPPNFALITNADEPPYARLPTLSGNEHSVPAVGESASEADHRSTAPVTTGPKRGHSRQNSLIAHNPRLSQIRFGDLSPSSSNGLHQPNANGTPAQHHNMASTMALDRSPIALLSSILLNLPFDMLSIALESPPSDFMPRSLRQNLIRTVIEARESRRREAVEAVLSGQLQLPKDVEHGLRSTEPLAGDTWYILGWQEKLEGGADQSPGMVRTWDPIA